MSKFKIVENVNCIMLILPYLKQVKEDKERIKDGKVVYNGNLNSINKVKKVYSCIHSNTIT